MWEKGETLFVGDGQSGGAWGGPGPGGGGRAGSGPVASLWGLWGRGRSGPGRREQEGQLADCHC